MSRRPAGPWPIEAAGGLRALVAEGGGLASLAGGGVELVQHAASAFEPGLLQLWVRDRASGARHALLGPGSGSRTLVHADRLVVTGGEQAGGLRWRATLSLHPARLAWAWSVEVANAGTGARTVDVVHAHDVALAAPGALRANELYVSQYLDLTALETPSGPALAVRQNLAQGGRHPWCVLACDAPIVSWATDALDVHGTAGRAGVTPGPAGDLPGRRRQHEHTLATLQTRVAALSPGAMARATFAGLLVEDHPEVTGPDDGALAAEALELARELAPVPGADVEAEGAIAPSGPYDRGRELAARALREDELAARWPAPWRAVERGADGTVLSFFAGDEHVVTRAKELAVLRPHGTILRSGDRAVPDPGSLTLTAWMTGSPLSYLTRGHVTQGRVLTTVRGYLGLHRAYGLRVFVESDGGWRLLDLPSAFAMTLDGAQWVYAIEHPGGAGAIEVRTFVPAAERRARLQVRVDGEPRRVLVTLHLATSDDAPDGAVVEALGDGIAAQFDGPDGVRRSLVVRSSVPVEVGDDAAVFDDGQHRVPGVATMRTGAVRELDLDLEVGGPDTPLPQGAGASWWPEVTSLGVDGAGGHADALAVSLPWLVRDALVHYLAPRGLEQYTGGAWGTRDVVQGPLELLLALDRAADARELLLTVFGAQNADGSWPQAFGFLPGDEDFRHEPPHGDVVHWPVLGLGRYLLATGDVGVLDEVVAWYPASAAGTTLADHVLRALAHARAGALPGTRLVAYGHGDWNDSLQPADPELAATLVSSWTVTLHLQSLRTLADGLEVGGMPAAPERAAEPDGEAGALSPWSLRAEADAIARDLHRYLLVDGELAGYAQLGAPDDRGTAPVRRYLVHPRDTETGLRHGSLQMIHALGADLFGPQQAAHHVGLVREHLTGVDGVRLFDRPPGYHGGAMRHFQRAETATFVGREIGLMYVHAHLRWCEAMARWGDADALWHGLQQVLGPDVTDVVPGARRRQANTYSSSSDAAVLDRADFAARYAEVLTGATGLEGGWRVYSSGPGVLVRIVTQCLLGVRRRGDRVEIDPVLPARLDGLRASVPLAGGVLRVRYRVGVVGTGVSGLRIGDAPVPAARSANPYRAGGLLVDLADLGDALRPGGPELEVELP